MTRSYNFTVYGHPITQGSMRGVGGGHMKHDNDQLKGWRDLIHMQSNLACPRDWPQQGPIGLYLVFHFNTEHTGRDVDKLARACMDALAGSAYNNDHHVCRLYVDRVVDSSVAERVAIEVERL